MVRNKYIPILVLHTLNRLFHFHYNSTNIHVIYMVFSHPTLSGMTVPFKLT
jgi:hypothetical protein